MSWLPLFIIAAASANPGARPSATAAQVVPEPVHGVTVLRDDAQRCGSCTITMTREVVLESGGEEFGGPGRGPLYRDSRGRYLHLNAIVQSAVLMFDGEGRFLQGVDREGEGPGEVLSIRAVVIGRGDTLRVLDTGNGRITTLTPDLAFVRSTRLEVRPWDAIEVRPGLMVINADARTPERFGYPLHPVRDGVLEPPMGGTEALTDSPRPEGRDLFRAMRRVSDSTFWAAHVPRYRFDLWRTDDTLLQVLTGDPEWFEVAERGTMEGLLNPMVLDLERDRDGLLWVLVRVRATDWRDLATEGPPVVEGLPNLQSRTGRPTDLVDSMIQVIDPETGAVLATERFDQAFLSFAGPRRVYTYEETDAGEPRVIVWQLRLTPP